MPRIYIAGPMTGLPDFNYPAFHEAAAKWRAAGWDVVNPAEAFNSDTTLPYREYVKHDLSVLKTCDAIAMLPGWDGPNARGSVWEREIAQMLGLHVYTADFVEKFRFQFGPPEPSATETMKASNPKDLIGSNKLPLSLFPATAIALGSIGMLDGLLKYGRDNFRAIGVRASIYIDAAQRHLAAWMEGEDHAPDNDVPHLAHALACLAIIVDADAAGKLTDDRKIAGGYHALVTELTPHVARLKALYPDKAPKHYSIADTRANVTPVAEPPRAA